MHAVHALREAIEAWQELIARAHELEPHPRLEALTAHLVHLYALGLRLGPAAPAQPPGEPAPWPEDWPGLGPADAGSPALSMLLHGLTADLTRAVELDDAVAGQWWRRSFDARWGTLATACINRLHEALVHARRTDEIETRTEPAATPPTSPPPRSQPPAAKPREEPELLRQQGHTLLPGLEPAPPIRSRTQRARPSGSTDEAGVLGLRFEASGSGLTVTAVHPTGPAKDQVQAGDLVLAIDGLPLRGRDDEGLRAALVGPVGVPRRLTLGRGAGVLQVELTPVAAESLAPPPLDIGLLVFDNDAFAELRESLAALHVQVEEDPDQPGQVRLRGPAAAGIAVGGLLHEGSEAGWWARVGPS